MNYKNEHGAISIISLDKKTGEVSEKEITNFSAQIIKEKVVTDGESSERHFEIEGYFKGSEHKLPRPLPKISVPASHFSEVKMWSSEKWGIDPLVYVGNNNQEHVEIAIRQSSISNPATTYVHLGWTTIDNRPAYLHAGGAIGASGSIKDLDIQVPGSLQEYLLPDPPDNLQEEAAGIKELISLLDLGARRVTWPILLYALSAPLGRNDYSVFVFGETGIGKTMLAKVFLSMQGCAQQSSGFGWHSTVNALELAAFTAKDSLILIDDFVSADKYGQQQMNNKAERLFRNQANGTGRSRMNANGGLQETKAPRGSMLVTGEDIPSNRSIRARLVILEIKEGDTDFVNLEIAQDKVNRNVYSKAFAGWIRHLASNLDGVRNAVKDGIASYRSKFEADHRRTSEQLAHLWTIWSIFSEYAKGKGALAQDEVEKLSSELQAMFKSIGEFQESTQRETDPIERFMELLGEALQSGRCYLKHLDQPTAIGSNLPFTQASTKGKLIGYISKHADEVYLLPDETYNTINKFSNDNGEFLSGQKTLWKRLADKGIIRKTIEGNSERYKHKVHIDGSRPRVVKMNPYSIPGFDQDSSASAVKEEEYREMTSRSFDVVN